MAGCGGFANAVLVSPSQMAARDGFAKGIANSLSQMAACDGFVRRFHRSSLQKRHRLPESRPKPVPAFANPSQSAISVGKNCQRFAKPSLPAIAKAKNTIRFAKPSQPATKHTETAARSAKPSLDTPRRRKGHIPPRFLTRRRSRSARGRIRPSTWNRAGRRPEPSQSSVRRTTPGSYASRCRARLPPPDSPGR